jgi:hypothetical protein
VVRPRIRPPLIRIWKAPGARGETRRDACHSLIQLLYISITTNAVTSVKTEIHTSYGKRISADFGLSPAIAGSLTAYSEYRRDCLLAAKRVSADLRVRGRRMPFRGAQIINAACKSDCNIEFVYVSPLQINAAPSA